MQECSVGNFAGFIKVVDGTINWLPRIDLAKIVFDYAEQYTQELMTIMSYSEDEKWCFRKQFKYPFKKTMMDWTIRIKSREKNESTNGMRVDLMFTGGFTVHGPARELLDEYVIGMFAPCNYLCSLRRCNFEAFNKKKKHCDFHDTRFSVHLDAFELEGVKWSTIRITNNYKQPFTSVNELVISMQTEKLLNGKILLGCKSEDKYSVDELVSIID
jgi:hypothetical protein